MKPRSLRTSACTRLEASLNTAGSYCNLQSLKSRSASRWNQRTKSGELATTGRPEIICSARMKERRFTRCPDSTWTLRWTDPTSPRSSTRRSSPWSRWQRTTQGGVRSRFTGVHGSEHPISMILTHFGLPVASLQHFQGKWDDFDWRLEVTILDESRIFHVLLTF